MERDQQSMTQEELLDAAEQAYEQAYGSLEAEDVVHQVARGDGLTTQPAEEKNDEHEAALVESITEETVPAQEDQPEEPEKKPVSTNGLALGVALGLVVGGAAGIITAAVPACLVVGLLSGSLIGLLLDLNKDKKAGTVTPPPVETIDENDQIVSEENPYE